MIRYCDLVLSCMVVKKLSYYDKIIYTSLAKIPLIWEFHNNNIMLKLLVFIFNSGNVL